MPMPNTINTESSRTCGCRRLSRAFWTAWNSWNESKNKHIEHKTGQREARSLNRVFLCPAKYVRLSARCIQQCRCPCVDTHKFPLCLPVCLAYGHQKIRSFTDLLKVIVAGYSQNDVRVSFQWDLYALLLTSTKDTRNAIINSECRVQRM